MARIRSHSQIQSDQTRFGLAVGLTALLVSAAVALALSSLQVQARGIPESFADIVEDVVPAVVNISTTQMVESRRGSRNRPRIPRGGPFEDMFRDFLDQFGDQLPQDGDEDGDRPRRRARSLGSGFIIQSDGLIVTNNHVIEDADEIRVVLADDTILEATVVGRDPQGDLALLKVEADRLLPILKWGDSDKMRVGDWSVAIGNPFGIGVTVTAGIVSARSRRLTNGSAYDDFLQTDAAINRGNSGGPLINMDGEVIGINTAIFSPTGASVGIGFASPSNLAQGVIADLQEFGRARRGWLGVQFQAVSAEIAESFGLDDAQGALVAEVVEGSPAEKAGVIANDVILTFDGKTVDGEKFPLMVAAVELDTEVEMTVLREGKEKSLTVVVGELKEDEVVVASRGNTPRRSDRPERKELGDLGVTVAELTSSVRTQYELPDEISGLIIVAVDEASDAAQKGLRRGDIIAEVQQTPVETAEDAEEVIAQARSMDRKVVLLRVRSGENFRQVPIRLGES